MNEIQESHFVEQELSRLPPSSAGDPFNFINEILEYLLRWANTYCHSIDLAQPAYCCFIGHERINTAMDQHTGFSERILFREDTPQNLLDNVYFCSMPFRKVYSRATAFKSLEECEVAVNALNVAGGPIIIFNAANRTVFWRTKAGAELSRAVLIDESAPAPRSADFEDLLKHFHYQYTETPQGFTRPWLNASKWQTKPDLEEEIRDDLFIYLRNRMRDNFAVFREFYNSSGRSDLLICFHLEKKYFYVELKVFRVSDPDSAVWGRSGITQAYTYRRSNENIGDAYACCFDGRKLDEEIQELIDYASELDVFYRRFFMYPTSKALQHGIMN